MGEGDVLNEDDLTHVVVAERDTVVFEAGSHDRSVRTATSDLLNLTGAKTADICREE